MGINSGFKGLNESAFLIQFHCCFLTHVYPLYQQNSFILKFSKQIHFNSCSLLLVQDVQHTCDSRATKSLDVFLNSSITVAEITLTVQYAINCQIVRCVYCSSGNACYRSFQSLLSSRLLVKN